MRKAVTIILFCLLVTYGHTQKYACFDSEFVLSSLSDYQQAQKRLDQYAIDWQKELEAKEQELESLRNAYQQEAYLLPENLKRRRLEDLKSKEQDVKNLQRERFGVGGDLDKKRAELIKPVQDRVFNALQRLANEKGYAFIFDKAGNSSLAYVNPKYDVSTQILEMLGGSSPSSTDSKGEAAKDSGVKNSKSSSKTDEKTPTQRDNKQTGSKGKMKR